MPRKRKMKGDFRPLGKILQNVVDFEKETDRRFKASAARYEREHPEEARKIKEMLKV